MTIRFIGSVLILLLILSFSTGIAGDRKKFEYLPPDRPCMFFLDEETGEPTGDPANPPCDLHTTRVNPGDKVDPELRKKYGKTFKLQKEKSQSKDDGTQ